MYKADMHVHTTASDGILSPIEVVRLAKKKNVDTIAITDHDTVNGVEEAISEGLKENINVVPGVEFSCKYLDEEVHIVGLFIDYKNELILEKFKHLSESRTKRGKIIVEKLRENGIQIDYNEVLNEANCDSIGKPHIARILINKGYAQNMDDAFKKYLSKNKPGDIPREKVSIEESISLIHNANGIAILAHPGLIKEEYLKDILKYDLDGLEVIHSIHSEEVIDKLDKLAKENNLIKSAGSDCHGELKNGRIIIGDYFLNKDEFESLKKRHYERMKSFG